MPKILLIHFVTAVLISGDNSQFDEAGRTPKAIFERAKGYFLKYFGNKYECAQDWNVKTRVINRNVGYRGKEVIKKIW